ncbi:hypothetical protein [Roseateles asaccharophilus]|uniref:Uncharacterized protein n=1 Tax=Roseateles asaccharophilus TaxID=582607 RepID=A0ABU2A5U7_9BURK|nr:hypothetical protein [Roseateles asaccharophilus]MDR7331857.1 hypothetical protein [Roseateles asaccharophilus]
MKPATLPHPSPLWRVGLPALLALLLAADAARSGSAMAQASARVVEPVAITAWLGTPVSVQDLLLARDAPAGPATGDLVPRMPAASPPPPLPRLPAATILGAVESRSPFAIDMAQSAGSLARGPAAAVSAAADHDGDSPLVITVAFN